MLRHLVNLSLPMEQYAFFLITFNIVLLVLLLSVNHYGVPQVSISETFVFLLQIETYLYIFTHSFLTYEKTTIHNRHTYVKQYVSQNSHI